MRTEKIHSHEGGNEQDIFIDLSILIFLREEMLLGNLDYVAISESYKQGLFASEIDCSWERFRRRALYQIGLGFTEPLMKYRSEEGRRKTDEKKDSGYLYSLRITPSGFMRIPELEKEMKKYEGFNRHITKIKEFSDKIIGMRGAIVFGITTLLVVCIFLFDIKVSKVLQKIPILSSIVDTKLLEEFETINEQDIFYKAMIAGSPELSIAGERNVFDQKDMNQSPDTGGSTQIITGGNINNTIKNRLPIKTNIDRVMVRTISPDERLFKITIHSGSVRYVQVKKDGEDYMISEK